MSNGFMRSFVRLRVMMIGASFDLWVFELANLLFVR